MSLRNGIRLSSYSSVSLRSTLVIDVSPLARRKILSSSSASFSCSARRSASSSDDFYSLLLEDPTPNAARRSIQRASPAISTSFSATESASPSSPGPPRVLFSTPLAGPSARMRGIARGEQGLDKPAEPENCCMSGCVNCVWDAYREEVEEWVKAKRKKEREEREDGDGRSEIRAETRIPRVNGAGEHENDGAISDSDEVGSQVDVDDGALFADVPVGIREFMATEKRLKAKRDQGGNG